MCPAAIYAEARHLLDWNARNPFCASCGYKTLSINAGFKRTCPPKDIAPSIANTGERPPCATRTGISNLCFPRTDPTVVMAVVSADGQRFLINTAPEQAASAPFTVVLNWTAGLKK